MVRGWRWSGGTTVLLGMLYIKVMSHAYAIFEFSFGRLRLNEVAPMVKVNREEDLDE